MDASLSWECRHSAYRTIERFRANTYSNATASMLGQVARARGPSPRGAGPDSREGSGCCARFRHPQLNPAQEYWARISYYPGVPDYHGLCHENHVKPEISCDSVEYSVMLPALAQAAAILGKSREVELRYKYVRTE